MAKSSLERSSVGAVDSDAVREIQKPCTDMMKALCETSLARSFSYVVSDEQLLFLEANGINLAPMRFINHTHSCHKLIENHFLLDVVPSLLLNRKQLVVLTMKESKFTKMKIQLKKKKGDSLADGAILLNFLVDSRDPLRYPQMSVGAHQPRVNPMADVFFFHDSMHHMSPMEVVGYFKENRNLEAIIGTMIVPIEAAFRGESAYPFMYSYTLKKKGKFVGENALLQYFPEGNYTEGYEQYMDCMWWFFTSKIHHEDITLTIESVKSVGSYHLFCVTRGSFKSKKYSYYNPGDLVDLNLLSFKPDKFNEVSLVNKKNLDSVISYCRSLKKPTVEAAFAKQRPSAMNSVGMSMMAQEASKVADIAHAVQLPSFSFMSELGESPLKRVCREGMDTFLGWFGFDSSRKARNVHELESLQPHPFRFKRRELHGPWLQRVQDSFGVPFVSKEHSEVKYRLRAKAKGGFYCIKAEVDVATALFQTLRPGVLNLEAGSFIEGPDRSRLSFLLLDVQPEVHSSGLVTLGTCVPDCPAESAKRDHRALRRARASSSAVRGATLLGAGLRNRPVFERRSTKRCENGLKSMVLYVGGGGKSAEVGESSRSGELRVRAKMAKEVCKGAEQRSAVQPGEVSSLAQELTKVDFSVLLSDVEDDCGVEELTRQPRRAGKEELVQSSCSTSGEESETESQCDFNNCGLDEVSTLERLMGGVGSGLSHYVVTAEQKVGELSRRVVEKVGSDFKVLQASDSSLYRVVSGETVLEEGDLDTWTTEGKKNMCLVHALVTSMFLKSEEAVVRPLLAKFWPQMLCDLPFAVEQVCDVANDLSINVKLTTDTLGCYEFGPKGRRVCHLTLLGGHYYAGYRSNKGKVAVSSSAFLEPLIGQGFMQVKQFPKRVKELEKYLREVDKGNEGAIMGKDSKGKYLASVHRALVRAKVKDLSHLDVGSCDFSGCEVLVITGAPGCGKTSRALKVLEGPLRLVNSGHVVISPRKNLSDDFKTKVSPKNCYTFERVFSCDTIKVALVDELSLYPPGYLTMLKVCFPELELVVCMGDPMQGVFHSERLTGEGELNYVLRGCESFNYLAYSKRLPRAVCEKVGVEWSGLNRGEGSVMGGGTSLKPEWTQWVKEEWDKMYGSMSLAEQRLKKVKCLFSSTKELRGSSDYAEVMTFDSSQGLTFTEPYIVFVDEDTLLNSDGQVMVAMTRGTAGVILRVVARNMLHFKAELKQRSLLKAVLNQGESFELKKKLTEQFRGIKFLGFGEGGGHDPEEKSGGDLQLLRHLRLYPLVEEFEVCEREVVEFKEGLKVGYPHGSRFYHVGKVLHEMKDRFSREFISLLDTSCQFDDVQAGVPNPYECIYPRHKPEDVVSFWKGVQKRLRFSNPHKEQRALVQSRPIGERLFHSFKDTYLVNKGACSFDQALYDKCQEELQEKKLGKSAAMIESHLDRSDPDWPLDMVRLFDKAQLCTKFEKRCSDATAKQTLACFHHEILLNLGPLARYVDKKVASLLRPGVYVHNRLSFDELDSFVKSSWVDRDSIENDYTAFDASQDAKILAFELSLLKHLSLPNHLVEFYTQLKKTVRSKLGMLSVMRFTGEFGTFTFNTLANMAFTAHKYKIRQDTVVMFAGDDSCINDTPFRRKDTLKDLEKLALKSKEVVRRVPMFCGWYIGRFGIVKNPLLVYERLMVAKEKRRLSEVLESYFLECMYTYHKTELAREMLTPDEIEAHHMCIRIFLENEGKMKGSIRALIHEVCVYDRDPGEMCRLM